MTYENYVQSKILNPLGMSKSTFFYNSKKLKYIAIPHTLDSVYNVKESNVYPFNREHSPSGGLIASISDMAIWLESNLNYEKKGGKKILKDSTLKLMFSSFSDSISNIGLSWFRDSYKGHKTISHSGLDLAFNTYMIMFPEASFGHALWACLSFKS